MTTTQLFFLALFGVLFLGTGLYGVHLVNKNSSLSKKAIPIVSCLVGVGFLWTVAAYKTPAVTEIDFQLVAVMPEGYVGKFRTVSTRNCKIESIDAEMIDTRGKTLKTKTAILMHKSEQNLDEGYLFIDNRADYDVQTISITVNHFCPFGFAMNTELAAIKAPAHPIKTLPVN